MKIIFLDIDGVLNVDSHGRDKYGALFHPHYSNNLKRIVDETQAKIVLSSSWRKDGLTLIQEMWKYRKLAGEIIDITPSLSLQDESVSKLTAKNHSEINYGYSIPRGCEVDFWINSNSKKIKIESYVILDDDSNMLLSQHKNFVCCSGNRKHEDCDVKGFGLTTKCTDKAIQILNQ